MRPGAHARGFSFMRDHASIFLEGCVWQWAFASIHNSTKLGNFFIGRHKYVSGYAWHGHACVCCPLYSLLFTNTRVHNTQLAVCAVGVAVTVLSDKPDSQQSLYDALLLSRPHPRRCSQEKNELKIATAVRGYKLVTCSQ